jgi:HEPN domain-containing protein
MDSKFVAKDWLSFADQDLDAAQKLLINEVDSIPRIAAFQCQQATEKYLKAFLVFHASDVPRTHIIEELIDLCAKIDLSFGELPVTLLSSYAVNARYPDGFYLPSYNDAKEALIDASRIRDFVLARLKY